MKLKNWSICSNDHKIVNEIILCSLFCFEISDKKVEILLSQWS